MNYHVHVHVFTCTCIYMYSQYSEGKAADASLKETLEELEEERKLTVCTHTYCISLMVGFI